MHPTNGIVPQAEQTCVPLRFHPLDCPYASWTTEHVTVVEQACLSAATRIGPRFVDSATQRLLLQLELDDDLSA